jgi:hypothetical protein
MATSRVLSRLVWVAAMIVVGVVVPSGSALAVTRYWNSKSHPLTAKSDQGAVIAKGYGKWTISTKSDGTRSRGAGQLRDPQPHDTDGVYFELVTYDSSGICVQPEGTSCSQQFFPDSTRDGGQYWYDNTWSPFRLVSAPIDAGANSYKGGFRVAEEHDYLPDIYSGRTITPGINW